jgi:hypothetical protein
MVSHPFGAKILREFLRELLITLVREHEIMCQEILKALGAAGGTAACAANAAPTGAVQRLNRSMHFVSAMLDLLATEVLLACFFCEQPFFFGLARFAASQHATSIMHGHAFTVINVVAF